MTPTTTDTCCKLCATDRIRAVAALATDAFGPAAAVCGRVAAVVRRPLIDFSAGACAAIRAAACSCTAFLAAAAIVI